MSERTVGPNGFRTGYNDEGDFVEWLPPDESSDEEYPMILRRSDEAIQAEYDELWEKVWYYRNRIRMEKQGRDTHELPQSEETMKDIEAKYGAENLLYDDSDWGLIQGRLSALAWVMGSEWDESLDT